jgi:hypothetical protein
MGENVFSLVVGPLRQASPARLPGWNGSRLSFDSCRTSRHGIGEYNISALIRKTTLLPGKPAAGVEMWVRTRAYAPGYRLPSLRDCEYAQLQDLRVGLM